MSGFLGSDPRRISNLDASPSSAGEIFAELISTVRRSVACRPEASTGPVIAYAAATHGGYSAREIERWLVWHLGEFTLYVGVVPVVALAVLLRLLPTLRFGQRALVAATVPVVALLSLEVAAFASQPSVSMTPVFVSALMTKENSPRPLTTFLTVLASELAHELRRPLGKVTSAGS